MNYIYKNCPACGSYDIKVVSTSNYGEDNVLYYHCSCCGENFNAENKRNKYLKAQELESKYKAEINKSQAPHVEEPVKTNNSLSAKEIFKKTNLSLVELYCDFEGKATTGTGIIISDLYILTNAHVVFDPTDESKNTLCNTIAARFAEEEELYEVEFVYADKDKDICLLMFARDGVRNGNYTPVKMAVNPIETGDKIYALGNTKGQGIAILDGIVSDNRRTLNGNEYFMFSAPVTHGNSGGPVFNDCGELIGMVTLGNKEAVSMNYAIPVDILRSFIKKVEEKEEIVVLD